MVDERRTLSPKSRQKRTGSWLEISGLLLVGACISYCLIAHDDIKTDFVAKVAVAKQELQVAAGLGPCGIDDTERDAFNAGWEIGNASSK